MKFVKKLLVLVLALGLAFAPVMTVKAASPETKSIATCTVKVGNFKAFTGATQTVSVTVKDGTKTLKAGTDYTVSGASRYLPGSHKITIKGIGRYTGSKTITKTIAKRSINDSSITIKGKNLKYTGKAINPKKFVKATNASGGTLTYIKVTCNKTMKKRGTYKITVTGYGRYTGSKTLTVKIK